MSRRLTPKGTQRRNDLMDLAARKFAGDGYHTTSVTSIVDGLGVGKGVFYWYFQSKDEMLSQILNDALRSMRLAQQDAIAGEPDPARRIEQGIRSSLRWLSEHRHLFVLMEFARTEERFAPIMRLGDQQTVAILGVTGHLARVLVLEQGQDADRVAEAVIAFCRQGYVAEQASALSRRIA
jgi:AcrR family transcriptional regulator